MRWYWIDRFLEFESGRYAKAIKNVSLAEEHLHDHFPGYPVAPNSLIMEGLAQTGGLLVCEVNHFQEKVVLAKVPSATFYEAAYPGDSLIFYTEIVYYHEDGAMVKATSHKNGQLQAEMELVFAHLSEEFGEKTLFDPETFKRMMHMFRAFEVGHARDGSRLVMPPPAATAVKGPQPG